MRMTKGPASYWDGQARESDWQMATKGASFCLKKERRKEKEKKVYAQIPFQNTTI